MSDNIQIPDIERITFFSGQRLLARDMTALDESHREFRWLHNQSLHAWGIGIGLEVKGERGATVVTVQPGYAIDRRAGTWCTEPRTLPIPAVAGAGNADAVFYLTARYVTDTEQQVIEKRDGICTPGGTVRLADEPAIGWATAAMITEGVTLILGIARVRNCVLAGTPISQASRRYARPPQLPYIFAGQTIAAKTTWQPWSPRRNHLGTIYACRHVARSLSERAAIFRANRRRRDDAPPPDACTRVS